MQKVLLAVVITFILQIQSVTAQTESPKFCVIGFYTAKNDPAHVSFVNEANRWFKKASAENNFSYDTTSDWNKMKGDFLSRYDVVVFLDTRPEALEQRTAFEKYIKDGGAWLGFHFAAFALSNSAYNQDWNWYHNEFLGSGEYKGNTWRPTSAFLRINDSLHQFTSGIPHIFKSAPNEWYSWQNDLRNNSDIVIIASIDESSFPLGTGPKPHEIWHEGFYPVVWTNRNYRMVYINMGHNDIDYEHPGNRELSFTFDNEIQCRLILNCLFYLGEKHD